jgi:hypothetical protein
MRRRILSLALAFVVLMSLAACTATPSAGIPAENQFGWWIMQTDGLGTYYTKYEENPTIQWLVNQYWNKTAHTLGTEKDGEKIGLSFIAPPAGNEQDNFDVMISTQEYPEIINLSIAGAPKQMYEDGVLIEITEYIEKYAPNYLIALEMHPEIKPLVSNTDENGTHYYALYNVRDTAGPPWSGYIYRRDWLVKYAKPTEYVWDWDSEAVKTSGHPTVTPLAAALESDDLTGWKKSDVTEFISSEGDDPSNDYQDNVIFPSGKSDPLTISDWEWMFDAFKIALAERGFESNTNAYCITIYNLGYMATGNLVSSFGGGNGSWYMDGDGKVQSGAADDNFKAYLECMHSWSDKGWLDTKFETRTGEVFDINSTGNNQGMVGLWLGYAATLGTTIRATAVDESDQKDAMVFPAALPVNDIYGGDEQKFHAPDQLYQDSYRGVAVGFTNKCEGKDMEELFSMINYLYSFEGSLIGSVGLTAEQYKSMKFEPDLYKTLGIESMYSTQTNEDGLLEIVWTVPDGTPGVEASAARRLNTYAYLFGDEGRGYVFETGLAWLPDHAMKLWSQYKANTAVSEYSGLFITEENDLLTKTSNYLKEYMGQELPRMIKGGLDGWDSYVKKIGKYAPDRVTNILKSYIEK